jgi:hypothetical protein
MMGSYDNLWDLSDERTWMCVSMSHTPERSPKAQVGQTGVLSSSSSFDVSKPLRGCLQPNLATRLIIILYSPTWPNRLIPNIIHQTLSCRGAVFLRPCCCGAAGVDNWGEGVLPEGDGSILPVLGPSHARNLHRPAGAQSVDRHRGNQPTWDLGIQD